MYDWIYFAEKQYVQAKLHILVTCISNEVISLTDGSVLFLISIDPFSI